MPSSPPYLFELPTVWLVFYTEQLRALSFFSIVWAKKRRGTNQSSLMVRDLAFGLAGNRITAPLPSGFRALGRGLVAVGARGSRRLALRAEARSREP